MRGEPWRTNVLASSKPPRVSFFFCFQDWLPFPPCVLFIGVLTHPHTREMGLHICQAESARDNRQRQQYLPYPSAKTFLAERAENYLSSVPVLEAQRVSFCQTGDSRQDAMESQRYWGSTWQTLKRKRGWAPVSTWFPGAWSSPSLLRQASVLKSARRTEVIPSRVKNT